MTVYLGVKTVIEAFFAGLIVVIILTIGLLFALSISSDK